MLIATIYVFLLCSFSVISACFHAIDLAIYYQLLSVCCACHIVLLLYTASLLLHGSWASQKHLCYIENGVVLQ